MPAKPKKVVKKPQGIDYQKLADAILREWELNNVKQMEARIGDNVYGNFRKLITKWIHDELEQLVYRFCCDRAKEENLRPPVNVPGTKVFVSTCPYCGADWQSESVALRARRHSLTELLDTTPVQASAISKAQARVKKVLDS